MLRQSNIACSSAPHLNVDRSGNWSKIKTMKLKSILEPHGHSLVCRRQAVGLFVRPIWGDVPIRYLSTGHARGILTRGLIICLTSAVLFFNSTFVYAQDTGDIALPPPRTEGGKPLMQALKDRKSEREFSTKEIPLQLLSDLLWAAFGINRLDTGGRTAPSGHNMQEIDIYVATAEGLYLYDAKANVLILVQAEDIGGLTGRQSFVKDAPINLIFVADHSRMTGLTAEEKDFYETIDTGYISQNVYLFCASVGLATVARSYFNKLFLTKAMRLRPSQTIILAQTVGYPSGN